MLWGDGSCHVDEELTARDRRTAKMWNAGNINVLDSSAIHIMAVEKSGLHSVESHDLTCFESIKANERDFLYRWATGPWKIKMSRRAFERYRIHD